MKLHEMLGLERRRQGKGQKDIAERANVSVMYISNLERGNVKDISLSKLQRVCKALNLSLVCQVWTEDKSGCGQKLAEF